MKLRAQRLRWHRREGPRTRAILLPIALALLNGCAGPLFYYYDTELPAAKDATLGSSILVGVSSNPRIEMSRIAVHFFSGGRLMGTDPAMGKDNPHEVAKIRSAESCRWLRNHASRAICLAR